MSRHYLFNARFASLDDSLPRPFFVEVHRGRIGRVGDRADWDKLLQSGALADVTLRDMHGAVVVPGFNDNHIHTVAFGDMLSRIRLGGLSTEEIVSRLRDRYADLPKGRTILAQGWDYDCVPNPHREVLDQAFPDNPVILLQFSGHGAWVNEAVLRRLRITSKTPNPPGGVIVKDSAGEPTGVLRDAAILPLHTHRFVSLHIDPRKNRRFLVRALGEYARLGITSVQDNTWFPTTLAHLFALRLTGRLTCRFTCWPYGPAPILAAAMGRPRSGGSFIRIGPWKYFLDGTFSTKTAWLHEPYQGEPENYGSPTGDRLYYQRLADIAGRRSCPMAFHAIGDRAVSTMLDAVEDATLRHPRLVKLRLRLEHAQLIRPSDMPRLRRLGILVAAQPHAMWNPEKDRALLGTQRYDRAYPYRSLLDNGVALSFGSDVPGEETLDPLLGISLAVNREGPEAITAREALACYTKESAYAEGQEDQKGTISPGKLADFAVLSGDPLTVPTDDIAQIQVLETIVGGKTVYHRGRKG